MVSSMSKNTEKCWLKEERRNVPEMAPMLCRDCRRFRTTKFMRNPEAREAELFLNGFRFALLQLAIQFNKYAPLSEEQKEYIKCMEIQTKCSIDRGIPVANLEENVREMMKQAEGFLYR